MVELREVNANLSPSRPIKEKEYFTKYVENEIKNGILKLTEKQLIERLEIFQEALELAKEQNWEEEIPRILRGYKLHLEELRKKYPGSP